MVGSEGTLRHHSAQRDASSRRPEASPSGGARIRRRALSPQIKCRWLLEHRPERARGLRQNLPEFARNKSMPDMRFLPGRARLSAGRIRRRHRAKRPKASWSEYRRGARTTSMSGQHSFAEGAGGAVWHIRESSLGSSAFIPGRRAGGKAGKIRRAAREARRYFRGFDRMLEAATQGGSLVRALRRRMRPPAHQLRSDDGGGHRDIPRGDGRAGRTGPGLGGSLSGEHGDGLARADCCPRCSSPI